MPILLLVKVQSVFSAKNEMKTSESSLINHFSTLLLRIFIGEAVNIFLLQRNNTNCVQYDHIRTITGETPRRGVSTEIDDLFQHNLTSCATF